MTNTQLNSNAEYGDPKNIDIFDEYERMQAYKKRVRTGANELKIFNHSITLTKSFEKLLDSIVTLNIGDTVNAIIIAEIDDSIIVSIANSKDSIYIDKSRREIPFLQGKSIGDELKVVITSITDKPYLVKGSTSAIHEKKLKQDLKNPSEMEAYDATIKTWTPAGYTLDLIYDDVILPAFMPNTLAGVNKLHNPESIVGETMKVMIESFSDEKGTYIVSRRKYLQTQIFQEIKKIKYDTVYGGHVTGTTPFGVFIEFNGCLTGMIHKTNINPDWQDKLDQIKPGMEIDFYIKEIIKDKIILTQILKESLWDTIKNGQKITGKVKDLKPFGVLVQLDEETVGLIHISEVEKNGGKRSLVKDAIVDVKVLSQDRGQRKIFLTFLN